MARAGLALAALGLATPACVLLGYDTEASPDAGGAASDVAVDPGGGGTPGSGSGSATSGSPDSGTGGPALPEAILDPRCRALPDGARCGTDLTCQSGRCVTTLACGEEASCGRTCDGPPGCFLPCIGRECTQRCTAGGHCLPACFEAEVCHTTCEQGVTCVVHCEDSECGGDCSGEETACIFNCTDAERCDDVVCRDGAVCVLFCDDDHDASDCSFRQGDGCDRTPEYCPLLDAWVCGVSCDGADDML